MGYIWAVDEVSLSRLKYFWKNTGTVLVNIRLLWLRNMV